MQTKCFILFVCAVYMHFTRSSKLEYCKTSVIRGKSTVNARECRAVRLYLRHMHCQKK